MTGERSQAVNRRTVLGGIAAGATSALAGCSLFETSDDGDASVVEDADRARSLAEQFAPTLYFDEHEQWFPTDPQPYEVERDGETVVDGFEALNGYAERSGDDGDPVDPVSFFNVVEYEASPLAVVQFWFYSAFDQFATNFHWHDWEVLHVFVDTETGEPQLYVASSHSRKVPNNEFLDPDGSRRPRILTELGSHSSGLSVNEDADKFQRLPLDGSVADVTNSVLEGVEAIAAIPLAYGLPRDEQFALPYSVPELDGEPLYDHDDLPAVGAEDLVDESLTVRSFDALESPPDLPERETGLQFDFAGASDADPDVEYELRPTTDLEHVADFVGPQLSFEFAIPDFVEDAVAGHITTTGVPWQSPRYTNPAADISEARHRQALAERYDAIGDPSPVNQVVAGVTNAITSDDAPENEGLTTESSSLELVALLQSEPEAVPTFNGIAVVQGVTEGEHRLTVNGAGVEPHSETVAVGGDDSSDSGGDGSVTAAGVDGEIPVVAREHSVKLEVDPSEVDADLTDLAVEDDFAGRLYDAPLAGPDAVYVHRGGAFTTEVRDSDDAIGADRVNPGGDADSVRVENPQTGKASLASYLADIAAETRDEVAAVEGGGDSDDTDDDRGNGGGGGQENAVNGLANALDAVAEAARRAAERAEAGDRGNADQKLETVQNRLDQVSTRLSEARDSLPSGLANAADNRLDQARRRSDQAKNADKL
ncbi:hypothetical protein [Halobacterium rubrum]|uniref:hypothetical protein n=1 Tax=Halobacterium TaxID=2239 RepID=UPI001F424574|nr:MULTISPECIES: hypothetical protein [Halobacterium]MDH5019471.1 hypothetical protein [Halobacterium rubrum]